jgi:hypothetical protein
MPRSGQILNTYGLTKGATVNGRKLLDRSGTESKSGEKGNKVYSYDIRVHFGAGGPSSSDASLKASLKNLLKTPKRINYRGNIYEVRVSATSVSNSVATIRGSARYTGDRTGSHRRVAAASTKRRPSISKKTK